MCDTYCFSNLDLKGNIELKSNLTLSGSLLQKGFSPDMVEDIRVAQQEARCGGQGTKCPPVKKRQQRKKWLPDKSKGVWLRKTWRMEGKVFVMRSALLKLAFKVEVFAVSTLPLRKG